MGQPVCVGGGGRLSSPSIEVALHKRCSGCYLASAGESLVSHPEMHPFLFPLFPLPFPFPEPDRTVSQCSACNNWPPLVPPVPQPCHPSSTHSTPLLLRRKEEDPAWHTSSLAAQSRCAAGKPLGWQRCSRPLSQQ